MINTFLAYVFLGLSLSAPLGPVNAAQLDKGARFGFTHAWLIGLGAMCADAVYMLLIYFGLAHFLTTPFMQTFLWCFGSFVLIYTGIESLRSLKQEIQLDSLASSVGTSVYRAFQSGFWMALLNPLNILFWLGIYGSVLAQSIKMGSTQQVLWHSTGIFTGILMWDIVIALFASSLKRAGNPKLLRTVTIIAAFSLIGFGVYFGWRAVMELFG